MNKNPFEIRADVLEMAKSYMDFQMSLNIQYAEKMYALGQTQLEDIKAAYTTYSIDELMAKAQEMYSFVTTKDKKDSNL